ncbi:hypothetical protein J1N35_013856 [Gossypium stocksii]|uniref:Uncharacterized protein n=1 Tax=Gossypium stocksii TaxID=47602 RepID=A0A9D4A8B5_9ROSI|nr:hypothetical protein J1N35_013856 [Gossypium stocksii]
MEIRQIMESMLRRRAAQEFFLQRAQVRTPLEEVVHDVSNFDSKDQCTTDGYSELNPESQQEFRIGDENKVNIFEEIFDLTNIDVDIKVEIELTTNFELQLILSETVDESIHFLAITEEVPAKEINEFISFSFDEEDKALVNQTSYNVDVKWFELIIP